MWVKVLYCHSKFHYCPNYWDKKGTQYLSCHADAPFYATKETRDQPRIKDRCKKCEKIHKELWK